MSPSENRHSNDNGNGNGGLQSLFLAIAGGAMALVVTLVLGGYGYTWAESNAIRSEHKEWKKEHQQVLDEKFEELKNQQGAIVRKLDENDNRMRDLLLQMIDEQKKSNRSDASHKSNDKELR